MDVIPAWYWMVIIAGLSGMLGLIMYYMAMFLRETTLTVREFKYVVVDFHDIMDVARTFFEKVNRVADTVSSTVDVVSNSILKPVAMIGTVFNSLRSVVNRFTGERDDKSAEEKS